jgi:hypothetical protein
MPMEIEGRTQPASNEPSVSYSFWKPEEESFQLRPVTPEQAQEMLKQNLLIRQIVEEGKPDFSLGSRIFGDGIFRWRKDSAELERWQALRDLVGADLVGADGSSGSSVAVPETEGAAWIRKHGTVGESASVGAALVPPEDKEYKPSESILDGVEYVPPGGSAQFGLGGAEGQSLHIQAVPLPGQFVPASAFGGGGSTVGTMGLGGVHYAIDPGDPEQGRPGGFQVFLSFAEVGPEGGVFSFDVSGDRPLNVSLPANYFASPIPQPRSELFADDAEYANYLEVHARLYETLELLQDRQLAIATGQQAPPRPPGGARMDSALNQLVNAGAGAFNTMIGGPARFLAFLADGVEIFPIQVRGPGIIVDPTSADRTLLQFLGMRQPGGEPLPVTIDNLFNDAIVRFGADPNSSEFQETEKLIDFLSIISTVGLGANALARLFHRRGGALMLQIDIPRGAIVSPGDMRQITTALQAMEEGPRGATLHPVTLEQLRNLALENPNDPSANSLFEAASRLARQNPEGAAALRAHHYLQSSPHDPRALQSIMRAFNREFGIPAEEVVQRGEQLHGQLNVRTPEGRLELLMEADIRDLASLNSETLSPMESSIVAARIAQMTPEHTTYISLDDLQAQRAPVIPDSTGAHERAFDQAQQIGAEPPDLTVGSSAATNGLTPDVRPFVDRQIDVFLRDQEQIPEHLRARVAEFMVQEVVRRGGSPEEIRQVTLSYVDELSAQGQKLGLLLDRADRAHRSELTSLAQQAAIDMFPRGERFRASRLLGREIADMTATEASTYLANLRTDPHTINEFARRLRIDDNLEAPLRGFLPGQADPGSANRIQNAWMPDDFVDGGFSSRSDMMDDTLHLLDRFFYGMRSDTVHEFAEFGRFQGHLLPDAIQSLFEHIGDGLRGLSPNELQNVHAAVSRMVGGATDVVVGAANYGQEGLANVMSFVPRPVRTGSSDALGTVTGFLGRIAGAIASDEVRAAQTTLINGLLAYTAVTAPGNIELVTGFVGHPDVDGNIDPAIEQIAGNQFLREGTGVIALRTRDDAPGYVLDITIGTSLYLLNVDQESGEVSFGDIRQGGNRIQIKRQGVDLIASWFGRGGAANTFFYANLGPEFQVNVTNSAAFFGYGFNPPGAINVSPSPSGDGGATGQGIVQGSYGTSGSVTWTAIKAGPLLLVMPRAPLANNLVSVGTGTGGRASGLNTETAFTITGNPALMSRNPDVLEQYRSEYLIHLSPEMRVLHDQLADLAIPRTDPADEIGWHYMRTLDLTQPIPGSQAALEAEANRGE